MQIGRLVKNEPYIEIAIADEIQNFKEYGKKADQLMIKISVLQQVSDRCLDSINVFKLITRSNIGYAYVLSVILFALQIPRGEDFLFSAGGGFLLGAVAGYAIKKVMKIAAVVIGLFVAALAYLSYRGWVDVKWVAMENASRSTLTNASQNCCFVLIISGQQTCLLKE